MPTQTLNGTEFWYAERGVGTPLVLLHGFPVDSRIWSSQLDDLSSHCRVITPDLRGFGRSRSDASFTLESLADDVHALLGKIDALPCILGGWSMGGYVTLAYAARYASDLKGLILANTKAAPDNEETRQARTQMAELARTQGAEPVAAQMLPKMLAADAADTRPGVAAALREMMLNCPPLTIAHAALAMRDRPDHSVTLSTIKVPTLILAGDADAVTAPAVAQEMHQRIAGSTLTTIHGAGHASPVEQPAQVNQAIRRFMAELA